MSRAGAGIEPSTRLRHVFATATLRDPPTTAHNRVGRYVQEALGLRVCAGPGLLRWDLRTWGGWGSNPRPADYESEVLFGVPQLDGSAEVRVLNEHGQA
jgi:hypothetical protein